VLEEMHVVRPVVETGYENLLQVRLLLEGTRPEDMLQSWGCAALRCAALRARAQTHGRTD
jgi:hypothetical protein